MFDISSNDSLSHHSKKTDHSSIEHLIDNNNYNSTLQTVASTSYCLPSVSTSSVKAKPKITQQILKKALTNVIHMTESLMSHDVMETAHSTNKLPQGHSQMNKRLSSDIEVTKESPKKKLCKTDLRASHREVPPAACHSDTSEDSSQDEPMPTWDDDGEPLPCLDVMRLTCEGCESAVSLERVSQCAHAHIICVSCVQEEVRAVMSNPNKLELSCPKEDCSSIIRTCSLEHILDPLVVELVKQNLHSKQLKASNDAIQGLQGIVVCPMCSFAVVMDENDFKFTCKGSNCSVVICRHCLTPWGESTPAQHQFCLMLSFVGKSCLLDITQIPKSWTKLPDPDGKG